MVICNIKKYKKDLIDKIKKNLGIVNFSNLDKFGYASHQKGYLIFKEPINRFFNYRDYEELKGFAIDLIERHRLYQEEDRKNTLQ